MNIDTKKLLNYLKAQHDLFEIMRITKTGSNDFNQGLLSGLDLVKAYIENYQEIEGKLMADQRGEDNAK